MQEEKLTDDKPEVAKQRQIFLTKDLSEDSFRVEKVINSVRYLPGQYLTEVQVEDLCEDEEWKVTVDKPKGTKL
jgi:hypothetical protein